MIQGDVLLEVLDKKCGKLRLPAGIRRIADDAVNGIGTISLETFDRNQVESWKPLLRAQRSELRIYSPYEEERIWLPLSHTGGFDTALSAQSGIIIDFDAYDSRFPSIQDRELKLQIALSRLLYPVQLSEKAKIRYEQLVKNRFRPAMLWLVSGKWNWYGRIPQRAGELLRLKTMDRFLKKELLEKSASCRQPEFTALLVEMESGSGSSERKTGRCSDKPGTDSGFSAYGQALRQEPDRNQLLWQLAEQELYRCKPEMEAFCGILSFIPMTELPSDMQRRDHAGQCEVFWAGTDGQNIFYMEQALQKRIIDDLKPSADPGIPAGIRKLARLYTHMLTHCIYLHPFSGSSANPAFSLACDIAAEYVTDQIFGPDGRWMKERQQVYDFLLRKDAVLTADRIYRRILRLDEGTERRLVQWFVRDSHAFWPGAQDEKMDYHAGGICFGTAGEDVKIWQTAADQWSSAGDGFLQAGEKKAGKRSPGAGHEQEKAELEKREGHDYRDFLRQFMVLREDRILDLDSYDPVYYTYGLNAYGNIPLVEPLETKEVMRLMELVIVIDTSGSCSGRLVRFFLEETWSVFGQSGNFFNRFHVRILQCDAAVQEDVKLTNLQEAELYMKNLVIKGGGGTDFRAAFSWIRELQRKGELRHLKGILYFTDGFGTFPAQAPGCRTAFIFLKSRFGQVEVPWWADKLLLELPEGADWEPEYTGGFRGNILR
ncbi:MAG: VWA-like domain-containing protein [Lachnospiraceae bacterium]